MFRRLFYRTYRRAWGIAYWLSRRFTAGGKLALACLMLATALGADTNQTTAYQATAFLTVVFAVSIVWIVCRRDRGAFSAERRLPRFGTAGQPLAYRVIVRNHRPRPQRGVVLLENLDDPRPSLEEFEQAPYRPAKTLADWLDSVMGYSRWMKLIARRRPAVIAEHIVPDLPARGDGEVRVVFVPQRRGRVHFNGVTLARGDVFGLLRSHCRVALPQALLILPKRYRLSRLALPGVREYQPAGVALASSVGQSDEFISLRDYRPGDPVRHIHWKTVAKTDRLVVREHEDEFFVRHALILDTFGAPDEDDAFEEAVSAAASFVATIQTQESLLDLLFVGPEAYCFTAGRGVGHVDQMLEILAGVQLCATNRFDSLETLVLRHAGRVSGCVCVFLAWDEPRQRLIKLLRSLRVPVRVCVVTSDATPLEFGVMSDEPQNFHHLPVGKIQEALARL